MSRDSPPSYQFRLSYCSCFRFLSELELGSQLKLSRRQLVCPIGVTRSQKRRHFTLIIRNRVSQTPSKFTLITRIISPTVSCTVSNNAVAVSNNDDEDGEDDNYDYGKDGVGVLMVDGRYTDLFFVRDSQTSGLVDNTRVTVRLRHLPRFPSHSTLATRVYFGNIL